MARYSPPATARCSSRRGPRCARFPLCLLVLLLTACSQPAAPSGASKPAPATPPAASQASAPAPPPVVAPAATPVPSKPAQAVTIRVGVLPTNLGNAGFLIAAARGYFAEQGITTETQNFDGGTRMVPPIAQGELEVGMGGLGAALYNAITRDIPIRIVADNGSTPPGFGWQGLAVRKELADTGLRTLADLKGKNIGLSSLASSGEVTYFKILEKTGMSDQDLTIELLAFPDQVVALGNGRLDSSLLIEPLLTTALENGTAVLLAGVDDINPGQQLAGVMYSASFSQQSPDAARGFMVGYVKGIRDYLDAVGPRKKDQEQVFGILANAGLVREPALLPKLRPVGFDPDGRVNARSLEEDQDIYIRQGHQRERLNMSQVIDNAFVDHAVRVLGPYQR